MAGLPTGGSCDIVSAVVSSDMGTSGETGAAGGVGMFPNTHWSVVMAATQGCAAEAAAALEVLCRAYWYPLYAYARRFGQPHADAQDLTQEFFSRLLE